MLNTVIIIYEHPFTQTCVEGKALVLKILKEDRDFKYLLVKFEGEERTVYRKVLKK